LDRIKLKLTLAVAAIVAAPFAFAQSPPAFRVVDLGTLGGPSSSALGLNATAHVVGRGPDAEGTERAFLWRQGSIEDLGDLGGGDARAYAINDSGRIAGSSPTPEDPDGEYQAFYYDPETGMRPLGTLGGSRSRAFALNNRGQVAGFARTPDGRFRAFLWDEQSGMVDILAGQGGAGNSFGFGINDQGEVAGSSGPDDTHANDFAYLWRDGEVINLGNFGGASAFAQGINEYSQVTGGAMTADGETHAFLWDDGELLDLGTFGGPNSSGRKVNNLGWVVGVADLPDETEHAFLWIDGDLHDLNELIPADSGWELNVAAGVNDQGFIVGEGTIAGETRAFLLTPVMYGVTELGTPGGATSVTLGLNRHGLVAGRGAGPDGDERAFLWSPAEGLQDLGTLGGPSARAYDVNPAGQVTGSADLAEEGRSEAFLFDPASGMQSLGTLGGDRSRAFDLNELGQAVGWSQDASGSFRAFVWSREAGMADVLGDRNTQGNAFAFGINDLGDIVGSSGPDDDHSTDFAFLRTGDSVVNLGDFGGGSAFAQGVNNRRQATGGARTADGVTIAFVWDAGELHSLGTLGGESSSGRKLNDLGQGGGVADAPGDEERGYLWSLGGLYDLSSLVSSEPGWTVTAASDISDRGQIAAEGRLGDGDTQGLLLTPLAELHPSGVINVASGVPGAVAPGQLVRFLGWRMGPSSGVSAEPAGDGSLPLTLGDVEVLFDEEPAELFFVREDQITLRVPTTVGSRPVTVAKVRYEGRETNRIALSTARHAPGLFTLTGGAGQVLASRPDWSTLEIDETAAPGDILVLWATGVGPAEEASVLIGGQEAELLYLGDAPGFPGLTQINLRLSPATPGGVQPVTLHADGVQSPSGPTLLVAE